MNPIILTVPSDIIETLNTIAGNLGLQIKAKGAPRPFHWQNEMAFTLNTNELNIFFINTAGDTVDVSFGHSAIKSLEIEFERGVMYIQFAENAAFENLRKQDFKQLYLEDNKLTVSIEETKNYDFQDIRPIQRELTKQMDAILDPGESTF